MPRVHSGSRRRRCASRGPGAKMGLDAAVLGALNRLVGRWPILDVAVTELATSNLAKGIPLVAALLGLWFARGPGRGRRREVVLATLAAGACAVILGRVLAHALPFRHRPIHDPALALTPPFGPAGTALDGWSSFPSDHAMLFGALATGVLFASRRLGIAALAWAWVGIFLPRVFLGWHHPSDILAGAALGIGLAALLCAAPCRSLVARPLRVLHARRPALFYAAAFVAVVEVATLFGDVRRVLQSPAIAALRAAERGEPARASGGGGAPTAAAVAGAPGAASAPAR